MTRPPNLNGLALVEAWNDESLTNEQVCQRLGLTWDRLREAVARMRRKGRTDLIERRKVVVPVEVAGSASGQRLVEALPPKGRSMEDAIRILQRQKRDLRVTRGRILLDNVPITVPQLFDAAYGEPVGKWR